MKDEDKNSMLFWYPKVEKLKDDVPQPKTKILKVDPKLCWNLIDGKPDFFQKYREEIEKIAKSFGFPLFLRTDQCSSKWDWEDSCFIFSFEKLKMNLFRIIEGTALANRETNALVFREYLPLKSKFKAFWGKLPISVERRYFVEDGKVLCHHPYWPEKAIAECEWTLSKKIKSSWKALLKEMNQEFCGELAILESYACKVSSEIEGYWSVDFAQGQNGIWYLIDMALGKDSWHPECNKKKV